MKIVYVNHAEAEQKSFSDAFPKHQVKCFNDLFSAYQFMREDHIPDIIITAVDPRMDPAMDTLKLIRAKTTFRKTIIIGYAPEPDKTDKIALSQDGVLDVVAPSKLVTTTFQIIQLFTQKHGKTTLSSLYSKRSQIAKRMLDVAVSGTGLLFAFPVMLAAATAVRIESKVPIFYRSKRVGSNYRVFDLLKFRTMVPDADKKLSSMAHLNLYGGEKESTETTIDCPECKKLGHPCSPYIYSDNMKVCENLYYSLKEGEREGIFFKAKDDPRISRVGKFLRNTSIDELPQLINILRGDMSLVGNRPLPLYEAEKLTSDSRAFRFLAPAGLTGLWQVTKRGKKDMSEEERIALDNNYALNHSLLLDIKIILKTFPALLQMESV